MQLDSINKEPLHHHPIEEKKDHASEKTGGSHNPLMAKMMDGLAKVTNVYYKSALEVINLISLCKNSLSRLTDRLVDKKPVAQQPAPSETIAQTQTEKLRLALHNTIDPRALLSGLTQNGHTDVNGKAFMAFFSKYPEHPSFNSSNIIIKDNKLIFKTPLDIREKATQGINIKELHIDGNLAMTDDFGNLLARLYILDETKQFINLKDLCRQLTADDKHSYVKIRASQDLAVLMNGKDQQSAADLHERYADYINELIEPRQQGDKVVYSPVLAARHFDQVRKDIAFLQVLNNIDAEFGAVAANDKIPALPISSPPNRMERARSIFLEGMLHSAEPDEMNFSAAREGVSQQKLSSQAPVAAPRVRQTPPIALQALPPQTPAAVPRVKQMPPVSLQKGAQQLPSAASINSQGSAAKIQEDNSTNLDKANIAEPTEHRTVRELQKLFETQAKKSARQR